MLEKFIKKFSDVEVKSVLDVACGPAPQLKEMAKRGYRAVGLDSSREMLNYLKSDSAKAGLKVETIRADMISFKLERKVDFAYIMMGSIIYVKNNQSFLSHLNSVANSLKSGGLYLIENLAINWADPNFFKPQSWTMKRAGIKVKTTYQILPKNSLKQIVTQVLKMEVNACGKKMAFIDEDDLKIIFPEEFKVLVDLNGRFEFVGFFERNKVKILQKASSNNIVLLRKK
ncbi:MAG: class I SAM-dependent methyltransferase [Patescibacteria group bacterium]|nr:class I SAM-dependent methyltransferase [Patescibacteria group bacterium]